MAGDTRDRILTAAGLLFAERGFAASSIRDLAARVGVSTATLYHHFPTKEAILDELLAAPGTQVDQLIAAAAQRPNNERPPMLLIAVVDTIARYGIAVMPLVLAGKPDTGHGLDIARPLAARQRLVEALVTAVSQTMSPALARLRTAMAVASVEAAAEAVAESVMATRGLPAVHTALDDELPRLLRESRDDIVNVALRLLEP